MVECLVGIVGGRSGVIVGQMGSSVWGERETDLKVIGDSELEVEEEKRLSSNTTGGGAGNRELVGRVEG